MGRQSFPPVPVLLTRPEEASRAFAEALLTRFGPRVAPLLSPLMTPEFLSSPIPPAKGVIFTSATGVEAARRLDLPALPAWCVGAQTARAAQAAGFPATSADGDAEALVALLLSHPPQGPLLHLRGADTRGDVANRLTAAGIDTVEATVYRQVPQPLTPEALALLRREGPVILPVFSPRSGALLLSALPPDTRATLRFVAISPAAAVGLPAPAIARRPDAEAVLDTIAQVLETPPPP